jgi:hypothetical protein
MADAPNANFSEDGTLFELAGAYVPSYNEHRLRVALASPLQLVTYGVECESPSSATDLLGVAMYDWIYVALDEAHERILRSREDAAHEVRTA